MQIKIINYKRIKNLGNYSAEHLEMTADLELGDDVEVEVKRLREMVEKLLGIKEQREFEVSEFNSF